LFLSNWELELRAGFTPDEELDAVNRLHEDYLNPDERPELEAKLISEVTAASEPILRRAREEEANWSNVTINDRLTAAFAALDEKGIFAKECCGATIQDGWGYVGLGATRKCRGAIFYHQEDVFDALHGKSLLLAFGGAAIVRAVRPRTRSLPNRRSMSSPTLALALSGAAVSKIESRSPPSPGNAEDGRNRRKRSTALRSAGRAPRSSWNYYQYQTTRD
jgi:hypothetical protein